MTYEKLFLNLEMIEKLHSNVQIQKTFNYGFAILKVFLAFDVICSHNFKKQSTNNKLLRFIDLIIITIIYFILLFLFRTNYLLYIQLLAILAYILQYSEINKKFYKSLREEKKECLGRLAEVVPYTVTGFTLASLGIIAKLKNYKIKTFVFSILIYISIEKYSVFSILKGIAYAGIKLNISSICIIFVFSLFPSEKIKDNLIKVILKNFTNFTAGVFYLHWSLIIYLKDYINIIKKGSFSGIIMIYLLCYIISFFGMKIFGKTKLKLLFL